MVVVRAVGRVVGLMCCFAAVVCNIRPVADEPDTHYPLLTFPAVIVTVALAAVGSALLDRRRWVTMFVLTVAGSGTVWALTRFVISY
jgi:hypothetical protein